MVEAHYSNQAHYIHEDWARPKQIFIETANVIKTLLKDGQSLDAFSILDVGCATGSFLAYFRTLSAGANLAGVDIDQALINQGNKRSDQLSLQVASALDLPDDFNGKFDIVLSLGCMSIFDIEELPLYFNNLFKAAKPDGYVVILSPLNEHGVDTQIRHRKRQAGNQLDWEKGWNIYAFETIREMAQLFNAQINFVPFNLPFSLPKQEDPVRTYTIKTEKHDFQLTNGLNLLINHYFSIFKKIN